MSKIEIKIGTATCGNAAGALLFSSAPYIQKIGIGPNQVQKIRTGPIQARKIRKVRTDPIQV